MEVLEAILLVVILVYGLVKFIDARDYERRSSGTLTNVKIRTGVPGAPMVSDYQGPAHYRLSPFKANHGSGYVVVRLEDNQRLQWSGIKGRDGLWALEIHGEFHHKADLQSSSFTPGRRLALVREPDNPHDPLAIAIFDRERKHQAGYIPAKKAKWLARRLDSGEKFRCISMWERRDDQGNRASLRVLLVKKGAPVKLP